MDYPELISDRKEARYESFLQLKEYIYRLAEEKNANRPDYSLRDTELVKSFWKNKLHQALGYGILPEVMTPKIVQNDVIENTDIMIMRRMKIEVLPGLDLYGILGVPKKSVKGLVICNHGCLGTPEHLFARIDPANYNKGAYYFLDREWAVFAPQLVLLKDEDDEQWPKSFRQDMHIDALWAGTTVAAIEIAKIRGAIIALRSYLKLSPQLQTGVAGLSYGGFYSLYSAAVLEEIDWCVCSCYFNDRYRILSDCGNTARDWEFPQLAGIMGDAEVAALICPRPLYIEVAHYDEILPPESAVKESERVKNYYERCGCGDRFIFDVFEGKHEFGMFRLDEFMNICRKEMGNA